jgi:ABC-type sugar transport system ATPase subunit
MDSVTAPPPLVRIRNLSKAFSGVQALANVHFDLDAGEVHALMGENGAGKSTLMKVLSGVYPRDSGEILLDGQAVEIASPRAAQALGIQIIHQELNLMNHLTAAQNIFIGREPRRRAGLLLDENRLNAQAAAIFARLHLALDPRTPMSELTVARQQMVEIAKALSFDSRVLIMDEPTAALNNAEIAELFRIIRQLKGHAWASSTARSRKASPGCRVGNRRCRQRLLDFRFFCEIGSLNIQGGMHACQSNQKSWRSWSVAQSSPSRCCDSVAVRLLPSLPSTAVRI